MMKHLIAVGACYVDTILSVSHYPTEDEKLRATSLIKRRGGNCPNTIEVLQQLCAQDLSPAKDVSTQSLEQQDEMSTRTALILASTLPSESSAGAVFIKSSFGETPEEADGESTMCKVDLTSYAFVRPKNEEPASSYIIKSLETGSRTIVNFNDLPEMTIDEFKQKTEAYLQSHYLDNMTTASSRAANEMKQDLFWYHFEGRIPETTLTCIEYLRGHPSLTSGSKHVKAQLKISVELEKPQRPGLFELAQHADVVFYSKSWAVGQGFKSAQELLQAQAELLYKPTRQVGPEMLICTWGEDGSAAVSTQDQKIVASPAWKSTASGVIDTIGAGDTFIAGMLYCFLQTPALSRHATSDDRALGMEAQLRFANELAGRKVVQEGFRDLGLAMACRR